MTINRLETIAALASELSEAEERIAALKDDLNDADANIGKMRGEIRSTNEQIDTMGAHIERLHEDIDRAFPKIRASALYSPRIDFMPYEQTYRISFDPRRLNLRIRARSVLDMDPRTITEWAERHAAQMVPEIKETLEAGMVGLRRRYP